MSGEQTELPTGMIAIEKGNLEGVGYRIVDGKDLINSMNQQDRNLGLIAISVGSWKEKILNAKDEYSAFKTKVVRSTQEEEFMMKRFIKIFSNNIENILEDTYKVLSSKKMKIGKLLFDLGDDKYMKIEVNDNLFLTMSSAAEPIYRDKKFDELKVTYDNPLFSSIDLVI